MLIESINNPRKDNGDFGDVSCDNCGSYSSAYVSLSTAMPHRTYEIHRTVVCKGCLLRWVAQIDKTILQGVVEKGRLKQLKK